MYRLPIICGNGIGDSFLVLGRMPITLLGKLGFRFVLFYTSQEHPAAKILEPTFKKIRFCNYTKRSPTAVERWIFSKMLSLSMRSEHIWRPPFIPTAAKQSKLPGKSILLHTHLDGHHGWKGATAKIWSIENWVSLCKCLHKEGWQVSILEWDANSRAELYWHCPFLQDGRLSTDSETFQSFSNYSCLFSIDSWSKYVASWYRLPQVVVVPDLRVGYCGFEDVSADQFAKWWMHGLLNRKEIRTVGLAKRGDCYEYGLPSLSELDVNEVMPLIREVSRHED